MRGMIVKIEVEVTVVLSRIVEVDDAYNADNAIDIARSMYRAGEIVLGTEDLLSVHFEA